MENTTLSNLNTVIGSNIKEKRRLLGLTQQQLSSRLSAFGVDVSHVTVGSWERGQRTVNAPEAAALCMALDLTPSALMGLQDNGAEELGFLSGRKLDILDYAASQWHGDKQALWEFCLLYMSLPPKARSEVAGVGIMLYTQAQQQATIDPSAPVPDLALIEASWTRLLKDNY